MLDSFSVYLGLILGLLKTGVTSLYSHSVCILSKKRVYNVNDCIVCYKNNKCVFINCTEAINRNKNVNNFMFRVNNKLTQMYDIKFNDAPDISLLQYINSKQQISIEYDMKKHSHWDLLFRFIEFKYKLQNIPDFSKQAMDLMIKYKIVMIF